MNDIFVGKSKMFGKGIFANRNFKKGEVVIQYHLKPLSEKEFQNLTKMEKNFTHNHFGVIYIYSSPERYVNHSANPNTNPDVKNKCDVAIRDIKKGEEITTDAAKDDASN